MDVIGRHEVTSSPGATSSAYHVVLLGDSVIDNGRYLCPSRGELSVDKQLLKRCIDRGWDMTMLAQDGSMLEDVRRRQLPLIPESATHLVLSVSGNDLLCLLNAMVTSNFSIRSVYGALGAGMTRVTEELRDLLTALKSTGRHVAVCTIYRPNFEHFFFKGLAVMSLGMHNSRIRGISSELDISVLDVARIHTDPEDFANPLELSTLGGSKLVENICAFIQDFSPGLPARAAAAAAAAAAAGLGGGSTHNGQIYYGEDDGDDMLLPAGPAYRLGASPMCCASRSRTRRIYASTEVAADLLAADFEVAKLGHLGPWDEPNDLAVENQQWRET